ncbi:Protein kinase [Phytophthora megakarya]|uniref:non-specific serine/threonine protein kinase n=1 Tax=Phytophthora megakarya TaxID=4795 RepID=A0A225WZL0_9STRA|nr:Protein kinase [Phytophthora megakarya]
MERPNRKRKSLDMVESSPVVKEKINELLSVWMTSETKQRKEISELRDEVGSLKKQLAEKTVESANFQDEAVYLHPDAVIDRIRMKLWHHGDLSLLRNAMDPRTRVTRNVNRSLFLAETTPKKGSTRPLLGDGHASELSPKHENEDGLPLLPPPTDVVGSAMQEVEEEKNEEEGILNTPPIPAEAPPVLSPTADPVSEAEVKGQEQENHGTPVPEINEHATRMSAEEREAMKRFGEEEIQLLRETFKGLANGKDGISVDKDTFLKCFPMRGLLGERLFEVIDKDGSGSIHYNEFVYGLAILFRGSRKEKLKFVFDLYDLSETGSISRHELLTMLHQFPESALELVKPKPGQDEANNSPEMPTPGKIMDEIEALVDLAFPSASRQTVRLTFDQFCHWCENTPGVTNRYYVLQGNFLYYYASPEDTAPRGVTFLSDCYVDVQPTQNEIVEKGVHYYGIDIVPEPGSAREKRTVFTRSLEAQKRWVAALRQATDKISIKEEYDVGAQLGYGRFSKVCEATHKHTGVKSAVKIIDKSKLQPTEKELLRTEIAILKLVRHPNIIRLYDVYEDRQYIFIVTELVSGGELFNRIVGRARYTEAEARLVMGPLLESVSYLHRLGIVHRDLKPENILCGDALTDLKIADFGLSKLVHPEELMKMPCGTLNYVAPEVLALVGYGREADIWSLGVIMYLLLRGILPFSGKDKKEVIQKTLHAEIDLTIDSAWRSVSKRTFVNENKKRKIDCGKSAMIASKWSCLYNVHKKLQINFVKLDEKLI